MGHSKTLMRKKFDKLAVAFIGKALTGKGWKGKTDESI